MSSVKISTLDSSKISVQFPFSDEMRLFIKNLGGSRWDGEAKAWIVNASFEGHVRQKLSEIFGTDGQTAVEGIKIRVTFKEKVFADQGPVSFGGKVFARAKGRDGGAKTGEDVALLKGEIDSGGSMKNWGSIVRAGAVFEVANVFPSRLKEFENEDLEIEVLYSPPAGVVVELNPLERFSDAQILAEFTRRGLKQI